MGSKRGSEERRWGSIALALLLALIPTFLPVPSSEQREGGECAATVIKNATLWLGGESDQLGFSRGSLVIGESGRIMYAGSLLMDNARCGAARKVDVRGRIVTPGLVDAHLHLVTGGMRMLEGSIDLSHVTSEDDLRDTLRQATAGKGKAHRVHAHSFDEMRVGMRGPRRWLLDSATGQVPTLVERVDSHSAYANTRALQEAGLFVSNHSGIADAGLVEVDESGFPTGVLRDYSIGQVRRIFCSSEEERKRAVSGMLGKAASMGVTTVGDMGDIEALGQGEPGTPRLWRDVELIRHLARSNRLPARVVSFLPPWENQRVADFRRLEREGQEALSMHSIGGLKAFIDGSIGSKTALLFEPFTDGNGTDKGILLSDLRRLGEQLARAAAQETPVALHAIGDRAVSESLTLAEATTRTNVFRIEHATLLQAPKWAEALRFAQSGVIASVQGYEVEGCASTAQARLGEERRDSCCAFNTLNRAGVLLALGTDHPISPLDPLRNIQLAVERTPSGWSEPFLAEEQISAETALEAYTMGSARALGMGSAIGSLEAGKWADVAIFDAHPSTFPFSASVWQTYIAGSCVHNCNH